VSYKKIIEDLNRQQVEGLIKLYNSRTTQGFIPLLHTEMNISVSNLKYLRQHGLINKSKYPGWELTPLGEDVAFILNARLINE